MGKIVPKSVEQVNGVIQDYENGDIKFDFSSIDKVL